jgi:hypothetical protein
MADSSFETKILDSPVKGEHQSQNFKRKFPCDCHAANIFNWMRGRWAGHVARMREKTNAIRKTKN